MRMPTSRRARVALLVSVAVVVVALGTGALLLRSRGVPPGPQLIFAEFGATADRIYIAPPADPTQRTLIATVEHVEGWGLNPAIAAAGGRVAYTVLPPGSRPQGDAPAELWLVDVAARSKTRLAGDADLRVPPVFDRAGTMLIYRSSAAAGQQALVRVDIASGARRPLHTAETAFGIYPVGFARDGALVFATLSQRGTDIYRVRDGEPPALLFHASDQIARDWRLSPGGDAIAYLAPELRTERIVQRLVVVRLDGADTRPLPGITDAQAAVDQVAPVWTPAGDGVTVGREANPGTSAAAATVALSGGASTALAAPPRGFDAPLGWSPDGRFLAARSFDGATTQAPGAETTVVIAAGGQRRTVTATTDVIFLGWTTDG
jgi:dipeptidyl aminopeptidase/acylaminoacyl peptidase